MWFQTGVKALSSLVECRQNKPSVVIVGAGIMGASAAYACKKQNLPFTLIESGHSAITSSWGESRILRLSYGSALYVNMMKRSYEIWSSLEKDAGQQLMIQKPVLSVFDETDRGSMECMQEQLDAFSQTGVEHSVVKDASALNFKLHKNEIGIIQNEGACAYATEALCALRDIAAPHMLDERIVKIDQTRKELVAESGKRIPYEKLILCAGAWTNKLLVDSGLSPMPYVVSAEQFVYYDFADPKANANLPIILEGRKNPNGRLGGVYAMPHIDVPGIKIGMHCNGQLVRNADFPIGPNEERRLSSLPNERLEFHPEIPLDIDPHMEAQTRSFVEAHMPALDASKVSSYGRCLYQACTLPDGRFLIGVHPENPDIVVACGFTGEGFKFAPVIGEFCVYLAFGEGAAVAQPVFEPMIHAFRLDRS